MIHERYSVSVAYDGLQALAVAEQMRPCSILLDVHLPKLDGFRVAEVLRQFRQFSETMIIGYSGFGGAKYYDRAQQAGMDFYLLKPADAEVLLACLEPENHPKIVKESMIAFASRELRENSANLLAKCQALSFRSQETLQRAQRMSRRILSGRLGRC